MGWQDIIALSIAVIAAFYVGRKMWRSFGGEGECHCAQADPTATRKPACGARTGLKRTALVTPDQVGKPEHQSKPF